MLAIWRIVGSDLKLTLFWKQKTYKYDCKVSRIPQFKMQFKVIASVLLFFVAQATAVAQQRCTLTYMVLCVKAKTNHIFSWITQAILKL